MFNFEKDKAFEMDQLIITHPVICEIEDTKFAEISFDEITYEKGSSVLKQIYKMIGDENFSNKLKSYFSKYKWKNTTYKDFFMELSDVNITLNTNNSFMDIATKWLTKAGLNEISLEYESKNGEISEFKINQKPISHEGNYFIDNNNLQNKNVCKKFDFLFDLDNLQNYLLDVLFIYSFENLEENILFKDIFIPSENSVNLEIFSLKKIPKFIILNNEDWGYFRLILDKNSLNYLKNLIKIINLENLTMEKESIDQSIISKSELLEFINYDNYLNKIEIIKGIYNLFYTAQINAEDYINITCSLILFEKNEMYINYALKKMIKILKKFNISESGKYLNKVFYVIYFMLKLNYEKNNNITSIKYCDENNLLNLLLNLLINSSYTEEHIEILKNWLEGHKDKNNFYFNLQDEIIKKNLIFKLLEKIFQSFLTPLETKMKLKEIESKKVENLDFFNSLVLELALPDLEIKKKYYEILINTTEDFEYSLQDKLMIAKKICPFNHKDLLNEYIHESFSTGFEQLGIGKDVFLLHGFNQYLVPYNYKDESIFEKFTELLERIKADVMSCQFLLFTINECQNLRKIILKINE